MTKSLRNRNQKSALLAFFGLAAVMAFAGCGGGGGGSSTPPPATGTTGTVTGTLLEASNNAPLVSRNVKVNNTNLVAATNSSGHFSLANVPLGTQVLVVTDSVGSQNGTVTINVTRANATNDIGTVKLDTSGTPPAPPI